MTRAVVDLRVDRPPAAGLVRAAAALRPRARAQYAAGSRAAAILATSPAVAVGATLPVAAWYEEGDDTAGFSGLLLHDAVVVPPEGCRAVAVVDGVELGASPALSPFLRSRWRARAGLPVTLVVRTGAGRSSVVGGEEISPSAVPAALAIASAVIADGDALRDAMGTGAPCVSDARAAAAWGAEPDVHVRVVEPAAQEQAARDLASDWAAAAALGHAARRLVEQRWDRSGWVRPLVAHLLGPPGRLADARMALALADLRTPPDAAVADRASAAVAGWA